MNYTKEERLQIASTIIEQLGGAQFRAMTGAKDLIALETGLQFSLPSRLAKNGINKVRIQLTPSDTYKIEYLSVRGTSAKTVTVDEDIYCDGLRESFCAATGLYVSL
jgi:hypothetical protein